MILDDDGDAETDDVGRELYEDCGKPARAIYSQLNPKRDAPDQPRWLDYPGCAAHDYEPRRRAARDLGVRRKEL